MNKLDVKDLEVEILDSKKLMIILKDNFPFIADEFKSSGAMTEKLEFYKAKYTYGSDVILNKELKFCLRNGGQVGINNNSFPDEIRNAILGGNEFNDPFGLVINKMAEVYFHRDAEMYRDSLLSPGEFIGMPRALDPENKNRSSVFNYNISAGARSAFILQRVSNQRVYQAISKNLGENIYFPVNHEEHWKTFASIAKNAKSCWCFEIIYFPRKFVELICDKKYASLYVYLNKIYTKSYGIKHGITSLWKLLYLSTIENNPQLQRYSSAYFNVIKHIFMVAANEELAFKLSRNDMLLPYDLIEEFFTKHYGLTDPCIMEPTYFDYTCKEQTPVYISTNFQDSMRPLINKSLRKTKIEILEDIKLLFDKHLNSVMSDSTFKNSSIKSMLEQIDIKYFHNSYDVKLSKYILMIESILKDDQEFLGKLNHNDNDPIFSSPFFAGGLSLKLKL